MTNSAQHLVIRASAGSGKTFQLTNRYLQRLMEGVSADEILAATFTRKAAGEILQRVLCRLANGARNQSEAAKLARDLGAGPFSADEFRTGLARLLRDLHRLRVGTLDSFFARLATNFTLELGLPPGWEIADERTDRQLRAQAIAAVLRSDRTADVARLTNLMPKGHAARSVSGLIAHTVDSFYGVFRETEETAWRAFPELSRLTSEQLRAAVDAIESAELPKHASIAKARTGDVAAARAEQWETLIGKGIASKLLDGETTYYGKQLADGVVAAYQLVLNHVRAVWIQEIALQTQATRQLLERFDVEYQRLKREQRSLRFEDVTHRLRDLFAVQDARGLAYRLDAHVSHLLLDEFQDTSPIQWDVLRPFAQRITSGEPNLSFFCVGDAKQAIYAWRGGVAEIFDALDDDLPGLQSLPLSESHRSSPPVIQFVNTLFAGITRHPRLGDDEPTIREWCAAFAEHTTAKHDLSGYACVRAAAVAQTDEGDTTDDILPTAARLVAEIVEQTPWASVGVLLRRNEEVAEVKNLLRQMHIPASEEGGNPITDSAAVLVVLSLLTLADHPGDTASRFHVATSPLGASLPFADHADDAAAAEVAARVRQQLAGAGYGPSLECWSRMLESACTLRDRMRLGQLVELGYRYDADATLRPGDFVQFVEQERFVDPSSDRVRVMTVHAAKGLEFDVVVAPLTDRLLHGQTQPYVAARSSPTSPIDRVCVYRKAAIQKLMPAELQDAFAAARSRDVRETLCRLYVTATRAVHALHLLVPASADSEAKLPINPAGLVRAALTDGARTQPEQILYEQGDRQWFLKPRVDAPTPAAKAAAADDCTHRRAMDGPVKLAEMPRGRRRGLARVAPSRHESPEPVPMSRQLRAANRNALRRGTLIHSWFEQIAWLDEKRPADDQLRQFALRQGFTAEETATLVLQFVNLLRQPQLAAVLSRSSYASLDSLPFSARVNAALLREDFESELRRESPIAAQHDGAVTTGTIDRLVLLRRGPLVQAADIIDFKTDAVDPSREPEWSQRIQQYRSQLAAYAAAVGVIHRLPRERIAARLVFVEPQVVVNVDLGDR